MIFYVAVDTDLKKHVLTVATEARAIDKGFTQIDIGTDKASLKNLIQESFDLIHQLENQVRMLQADASINTYQPLATAEGLERSQEQAPGLGVPDDGQAKPSLQSDPISGGTAAVSSSFTATQIEDFILNIATVAQTENILSCLGCRMAELVKENAKLKA